MAVKERITFLDAEAVLVADVTANTSVNGQIIDSAKYDMGVSFALLVMLDTGTDTTYTVEIQHGDASDLSDATNLEKENLVFGRKTGVFPYMKGNNTPGNVKAKLSTEGVLSTKRYLRPVLKVTNWDGGGTAYAFVVAVKNPEVVPTTQRLG